MCGAVAGAVMVIGLARGAGSEHRDNRDEINALAREFMEKFRALNGSVLCRDLIEYDITTREGLEEARMKGGFAPCAEYVGAAARILEEMLP